MPYLFVAILAVFLSTHNDRGEEIYPGYTWREVSDGIYAHSQNDPLSGPVDGNSTVIVNETDVFVVDTHINPAVARAVIAKIREITDNAVTHVVNTHWHDDHTNGNHAYRQAFPDARIVSHRATLSSLREEWAPMEDQRRTTYASLEGRDLLAAADAAEADDPQRAIGIRVFAGYREALEPELPTMELVYPDLVLDERMVFERGERTIVLEWPGHGNTDGDVVVWLPDDDVLITGDILVSPVPYAFDSPMLEWIATLAIVREFGAGTLIPGHGAVQHDTQYLDRVVTLLAATLEAVATARAGGVQYADLATSVDLSDQEALFTAGDAMRTYAWNSYYLTPGLGSAWASLGYPVPGDPR